MRVELEDKGEITLVSEVGAGTSDYQRRQVEGSESRSDERVEESGCVFDKGRRVEGREGPREVIGCDQVTVAKVSHLKVQG